MSPWIRSLQGPCPGEPRGLVPGVWGQAPGVGSAHIPAGWACALSQSLGLCSCLECPSSSPPAQRCEFFKAWVIRLPLTVAFLTSPTPAWIRCSLLCEPTILCSVLPESADYSMALRAVYLSASPTRPGTPEYPSPGPAQCLAHHRLSAHMLR